MEVAAFIVMCLLFCILLVLVGIGTLLSGIDERLKEKDE